MRLAAGAPLSLLALGSALGACSLLLPDFEDGASDSSLAAGGATGNGGSGASGGDLPGGASVSSAGPGGAGGSLPQCVPSAFHVGFDERSTSPFADDGAGHGAWTPDESASGRGGGWLIAVPQGAQQSRLRYDFDYTPDTDYWFGFAQRYLDAAAWDGTNVFHLECVNGYIQPIAVEMRAGFPALPFDILHYLDPPLSVVVNDMGEIEADYDGAFHEWVIHLVLSTAATGEYQVFHDGVEVYRATGATLPADCGGLVLRVGISRAEDEFPPPDYPPQSLVQDELRLVVSDQASQGDVLYTLSPTSGCP